MHETPLVADEVRAALWEALLPVLDECSQACQMWDVDPDSLRYVVQLHPVRVQVAVAGVEGRPGRRIVAFRGDRLPDGGEALTEAAEALAGGVLGALPGTAAENVMESAAIPGGGLFVVCDPSTEHAALVLAAPDDGLEKAVMLGGLGGAVTAH